MASSLWEPVLAANGDPIYSQVLAVLESDISSGRLPAGFRMPTQRELAKSLGISAGTVTKAYAEAERLGLVQGQVGRGTFVNGRDQVNGRSRKSIDLSLNLPGPRIPAAALSASFTKLGRRSDLIDYTGYCAHAGIQQHRETFCLAMNKYGYEPSSDNMLITHGAQHSMVLAFGAICRPGDMVLTEAATYHGMKALADFNGLQLHGVAMDEEGLLPDRLDEACRATKARVLFTMPTLQNPTARTMGAERRRDIAKVARKHDLLIVEDDVYGFFSRSVKPIAQIAPERTFYINSVSKCVVPGLRVGLLVVPPAFLQQTLRAMRATAWMASPLNSLIVSEWILDGTVPKIVKWRFEDAVKRTQIAKSILGDALPATQQPSFHVWLDLAPDDAMRVSNYAHRHGVITTPMSASIVDQKLISGLRLSIGAPAEIEDLEWSLKVIADGLAQGHEHHASFI